MLYGRNMTNAELITATEATRLLGYQNRSSLTRLVQAEKIKPAFTASGKRGEQFFNLSDILALHTDVPVNGGAA